MSPATVFEGKSPNDIRLSISM